MVYAGKGGIALLYIGIIAIKYQVHSAGFHKREQHGNSIISVFCVGGLQGYICMFVKACSIFIRCGNVYTAVRVGAGSLAAGACCFT
jgi:hypothetical protein